MNLDLVSSGSAPLLAEASDVYAFETAVPDRIDDESLSHPSVSHAVNVLCIAESDDKKALAVDHIPPSSCVGSHAVDTTPVAAGAVPSEAYFASGTRFRFLSNQPSVTAALNPRTKSTPPLKRDFGCVKLAQNS